MDTLFNDKCIVIRVKQEIVSTLRPIYKEDALYEAVRWCWRVNLYRTQKADYVLAVVNYGTSEFKVEAVFKPDEWYLVPSEKCKGKKAPDCTYDNKPCGRIGFFGNRIEGAIADKYLHKVIPMGQNPVKYLYDDS